MAGKGGYQAPANPAPVSGMGANSARTDGGPADAKQPIRQLPDAKYGENKEFVATQQGAPVPSVTPATPQLSAQQAHAIAFQKPKSAFGAPTQRPDEPVTAGAAAGAGPGPEALFSSGSQASGAVTSILQGLASYDMTGSVQALLAEAKQRGL